MINDCMITLEVDTFQMIIISKNEQLESVLETESGMKELEAGRLLLHVAQRLLNIREMQKYNLIILYQYQVSSNYYII